MSTTPQGIAKFHETYITSSEMTKYLGITRAGFLYGRRSGKITAEPVSLSEGRAFIWERAAVATELEAWKLAITQRVASA